MNAPKLLHIYCSPLVYGADIDVCLTDHGSYIAVDGSAMICEADIMMSASQIVADLSTIIDLPTCLTDFDPSVG